MKNIYTALLMFVTAVAGAQIVNIPDANLKARLIWNGYDTNADNEIQVSEAQAVTGTVNLNLSNFSDITGIEAFSNMEYLRCEQNNSLTSVSLANMPNLKAVHFSESLNLQTLTLTNMTGLDTLKCHNSKLTGALDLAGAPNLKSLDVRMNFLTSLNVSACSNLKQLLYGNNNIAFTNLATPAVNLVEELDCSANGISDAAALIGFGNLKVLNCSSNPSLTSLSLNNLPLLEKIYYNNCQSTSFYCDPLVPLKELYLQGNALTTLDLSVWPTLERVQADGNHLTSLTFGSLPNLYFISAALNDLTSVDVSGLTNVLYINIQGNDLTSLDVSNLVQLQDLYCGNSPLSTLNITNTPWLSILDFTSANVSSIDLSGHINLAQLRCGANPLGSLDLSGVPNLEALICWQAGLTALDVSMLPNLSTLLCNDNQLTTLDCNANAHLSQLDIYANPIQTLFIKNGSQQYFNDAGNFVENPDLVYICADEDEIAYLQSKPGMNASVNSYCSMEPGGDHNTVTGTVRFDADGDGCQTTDFAIPYMKIDASDSQGSGSVYSGQDGVYRFYTADMTCSLWPNFENPSYFQTFLPTAVNFPSMNSTVTQDFCVAANGVHRDLEIVVAPVVPARPGFEAVYKIVIRNKGNQVMSMPLGFSLHYNADLMTFLAATTAPDSQGAGLLQWDYANLQPFESRSVDVVMEINAPTHPTHPVNVDDELTFNAVIETVDADEMPDDNAFELNQIVIGSFDPNNMICLEGDFEPVENIGEYLHYIANFENTGTDAAVKIVVKTEFNEDEFDVSSLRVLHASHPVQIAVDGNKAEYVFNGINLAIGGHGNILLKIKTRDNLANGDMVANRADIFFDYNFPITTNDAETTFQMLSVGENEKDDSIAVYPNPTAGEVNVKASTNIRTVQLYDLQGRLLQTALRNNSQVKIDISDRQSGMYFLKVISEKGTGIEKIVKK